MLENVTANAPSYRSYSRLTARRETDPRLLVAIGFIEKNYGQPWLGLKNISESAGLSIWHFSRLFNAMAGMGLREYLRNLRLRHACDLLQSSSVPIKEVATTVGYKHLSDFYHHFKQEYKISPRAFRSHAHREHLRREKAAESGKKTAIVERMPSQQAHWREPENLFTA